MRTETYAIVAFASAAAGAAAGLLAIHAFGGLETGFIASLAGATVGNAAGWLIVRRQRHARHGKLAHTGPAAI